MAKGWLGLAVTRWWRGSAIAHGGLGGMELFGTYRREAARSRTCLSSLCLPGGVGKASIIGERGLALGHRGFELSTVTYESDDLNFSLLILKSRIMESPSQGHWANQLRLCWQKKPSLGHSNCPTDGSYYGPLL